MWGNEQYREGVAKVEIFQGDFKLHINIVAFWYLLLFFLEASAPAKWEATKWAPTTPTEESAGKRQLADLACLRNVEKQGQEEKRELNACDCKPYQAYDMG